MCCIDGSNIELMNEITEMAKDLNTKELAGLINSLQVMKQKKEEELNTPDEPTEDNMEG